ncbi:hypothetical protein [Dyadobacter alkalitolerans]|uniref:hypothetical protein n=1 Tax=Dyadobacter alkalitolerans TaxID=492736 RepID=UPI000417DDD5|nr:hypothetical protein [Dyadobacter alkalitolerans]
MLSNIFRNWVFLFSFLFTLLLLQACQDEITPNSDLEATNASGTDEASITRVIEKIETAYTEGELKIETGGPKELETQASPLIMASVKSRLLAYQKQFESRYNESSDFSEAYPVGVIPMNEACPAGTTKIKFMMDNQDNGNSAKSGWTGSWYVNGNGNGIHTLCSVWGGAFTFMTLNKSTQYLLVRLGNSKTMFMEPRVWNVYFDNEDNNNANTLYDGNLGPGTINSQGINLQFWAIAGKDTPGVNQSAEFPDLGFSYGVFGTFTSPVVGGAAGMGTFKTDDENKNNANQLYSVDWTTNVITHGSYVHGYGVDRTNDPGNTLFNIRRVR